MFCDIAIFKRWAMTSLLSWIACDSRKPAAVYIAVDSRITWKSAINQNVIIHKWDYAQKSFILKNHPDIFGYCGDSFYVTQIMSQYIDLADNNILFAKGEFPTNKFKIIFNFLETHHKRYPLEILKDYSIVYYTYYENDFWELYISFSNFKLSKEIKKLDISKSQELYVRGSGQTQIKKILTKYKKSDIAGTSRMYFTSFCSILDLNEDSSTGGAPQLIGLYNNGQSKIFGVISKNKKYILGSEIVHCIYKNIEWRNNLFELCEGETGAIKAGAQRQPDPLIKPTR